MKILVVDDDHDIVELLSIYIRNEGYEAIAATSGTAALQKLEQNPDIDLMILDIMMPDISGIEVLEKVRATSQIPIIIVSAKTSDLDKIKGLISGADDYVVKPFNPLEVMARIKSLLRRTHAGEDNIPNQLTIGPITINKKSHEVVTTTNGEKVIETVWGVGYKVEA